MKNILCLFIYILTLHIASAQNYFTGSVIEADTKNNVSKALITIEKTALAQKTADDGSFSFFNTIPVGEHIVTIEKEGYDTKFLLINSIQGKILKMDSIAIQVDKKEKAKRIKTLKEQKQKQKKLDKLKEIKLANAQKEKEKREKLIEKERKRLTKNTPPIKNTPATISSAPDGISTLQTKYSALLGITPEKITNKKLYQHIDDWIGIGYKLGGETIEGIDCSSLTQQIYSLVYNNYIERTAEKQYNSKLTDKFTGKDYLREGDLVFFRGTNENENTIVHVGLYLDNNKFVHSTSYKKDTGNSGVKIGDLNNKYWKRLFVAGGKRTK